MIEKDILEEQIKTIKARQSKLKKAGLVLTIVGACLLWFGIILLIFNTMYFSSTVRKAIDFVLHVISSLRVGNEIGRLPFSKEDIFKLMFCLYSYLNLVFANTLIIGGVTMLVLPGTLLKHQIYNRQIKLAKLLETQTN